MRLSGPMLPCATIQGGYQAWDVLSYCLEKFEYIADLTQWKWLAVNDDLDQGRCEGIESDASPMPLMLIMTGPATAVMVFPASSLP